MDNILVNREHSDRSILLEDSVEGQGQIVVANRNSASISVIDVATDTVALTVDLPQGLGNEIPEPMYLIYLSSTDEIVVGDRANHHLVFFDRSDYSVNALIPLGGGIFHVGADPDEKQL